MINCQVIVVGAGIAGLVAAYQLKKNGITPVVLEASHRVGGRMISDCIEQYIMDAGAQFLSSGYPILSELIKEFGIEDEFVETSRLVGIVRQGKIRKFRYDQPLSLLFGGLLNIKEWLAFCLASLRLLNKTKGLPLNNYSEWKNFDYEDSETWSNGYYGNTITEYFVEPMLEAFYFQNPKETSKALPIAIHSFSAHKPKTMTLVNGIGTLPELIADKLDIKLNTPVHEIFIKENEILVITANQKYKADRVILSTPAPVSRRIYHSSNALESELLKTSYSSTINVAIALKTKLARKSFEGIYGVWIPRKERQVIAAFTIETAKDAGRAVTGELIHVMLSGEAGKIMVKQDDEEIISTILQELELYLPYISENVAFTKIYRWLNAEPKSHVGRSRNIYDYRSSINKHKKVILAGDYMGMPFTEGAAETGIWAASTILKNLT